MDWDKGDVYTVGRDCTNLSDEEEEEDGVSNGEKMDLKWGASA